LGTFGERGIPFNQERDWTSFRKERLVKNLGQGAQKGEFWLQLRIIFKLRANFFKIRFGIIWRKVLLFLRFIS